MDSGLYRHLFPYQLLSLKFEIAHQKAETIEKISLHNIFFFEQHKIFTKYYLHFDFVEPMGM